MGRPFILAAVVSLFLVPADLTAEGHLRPDRRSATAERVRGGPAIPAKAISDTLVLIGPWGSGALVNGQFETQAGAAAWNGWTHEDRTLKTESAWHVSDYNAAYLNGHPTGNLAAYCGDPLLPACSENDTVGGYPHYFDEAMEWVGTVADTSLGCRLDLDAWLNHDLEPGEDYLTVQLVLGDGTPVVLDDFSGTRANVHLQTGYDLDPGEYAGPAGNEVHLRFLVESDGAWSDEDCRFPTRGACQIDDVTVTLDNGGTVSATDFEDGTLGDWSPWLPPAVGDFSQLRDNLVGLGDDCTANHSPQVCFIDDGVVVPGTGGTMCISWCYGPGGYIVNNSGGLAGPEYYLDNAVLSPVIPWPAGGYAGGNLHVSLFDGSDLSATDPGIFFDFGYRTCTTGNPDDLAQAAWMGFPRFYPGPGYFRLGGDLDIGQNPTHVQVMVAARELGYLWGWTGSDGNPGPYFDNVRLTAYRVTGPTLSAQVHDLAQDAFPAGGALDLEDLGANSVRFDAPSSISPDGLGGYTQGDSIVVRITSAGTGNYLQGLPRLYYRLKANPLFEPYRTAGLPDVGFVEGDSAVVGGLSQGDLYVFDLPDEGFLFPGDELHYFIEATQWDPAQGYTTSVLPADTTGFSSFASITAYAPRFSIRALPSLAEEGSGGARQEVRILYWDDRGRGDDQVKAWQASLDYCDHRLFAAYDFFFSNSDDPDRCGLGASATPEQLAGYDYILYNGDGNFNTPLGAGSGGAFGGLSPDVPLLEAWLQGGDKGLLMTGDGLVGGLLNYGGQTSFVPDRMGVTFVDDDVAPFIGNQVSPTVSGTDNPYLGGVQWVAYGGCPHPGDFEALETVPAAERLAEFLSPLGWAGVYSYSAVTGRADPVSGSRVVSLPYALERIEDVPAPEGTVTGPGMRSEVLLHLLEYLQVPGKPLDSPPDAGVLTACSHPNPFNPAVRIDFDLPKAGRARVRIYNLRGALVRDLLDEPRAAGANHVAWDGADGSGRQAASGVYFYEVTAGGASVLGKMTMVK